MNSTNNIIYHHHLINQESRALQKKQTPHTFWFTGLSGAGKSSLANGLDHYLYKQGKHTMLLDGDNIRFGLNNNLGFSLEDRQENLRRIAEVAKLMNQAGLIVIVSTISPTIKDREMAKQIIGHEYFSEIYVSTPLKECENRDIKGLYKKAKSGEISNFTGIHQPYEIPQNPTIKIDTIGKSVDKTLGELIENINNIIR